MPNHAGLPKIASTEAALAGHAADTDKSEIGVKGMGPASFNVRKFDRSERGEGGHPKLSTEDVQLGDGTGRDIAGKVQIVGHDGQIPLTLQSTGKRKSGRTAVHDQSLLIRHQRRCQCANSGLRIAVGARTGQERRVKAGKIISPDDPAIGPDHDALLVEILKVPAHSVSGYVEGLNEHADGGLPVLLDELR
jgi:hypothetical protein